MPSEIDPGRLYSFPGKKTSIYTLHRWRLRGQLVASCRESGTRRWWFVRGSELLRHADPDGPGPAPEIRSPAARSRGHERAMASLRAAGLVE
jgi:hypothetical protein